MAKLIQAIVRYGPRIDLNRTAQLDQVAAWISARTGLNKSEVMMMLQELHEAILDFNGQGTSVKLPGLGTFAPAINRSGKVRVSYRSDAGLRKGLNAPGGFRGTVVNRAQIGVDNEVYKALWDAEHPEDPLEI